MSETKLHLNGPKTFTVTTSPLDDSPQPKSKPTIKVPYLTSKVLYYHAAHYLLISISVYVDMYHPLHQPYLAQQQHLTKSSTPIQPYNPIPSHPNTERNISRIPFKIVPHIQCD